MHKRLLCDGAPTVTRWNHGARRIRFGRAIFRLIEFQVLKGTEVRLGRGPDDDLARADVDATDPVARFHHHALRDGVDPFAVEIDYAGGPQGRNGPAGFAAELVQL